MSIRRNTRLRREYLYRKSLEGADRSTYERKRQLKAALQEGKAIPTEIRSEVQTLKEEIDAEDVEHEEVHTHVDDEYGNAGIKDPKVLITTSRDPSSRLTQFTKELRLIFPNSQRINRGGTVIKDIVDACRANDVTDLCIVHEHRGEPDGLIVSHLPFGPTAYFGLSNCVMRHDLDYNDVDTMSEAFPHLVFDDFTTPLGQRISNVLKYLFPVPKLESRRVISFANRDDFISFRHHVYKKTGHKEIDLKEVGPRFEMRLYQLKLGTIDMPEAESEWVLRPYMNTAKRRKAL